MTNIIARRESLGFAAKIQSLAESEQHFRLACSTLSASEYFSVIVTRRFSPGYNVRRLWRLIRTFNFTKKIVFVVKIYLLELGSAKPSVPPKFSSSTSLPRLKFSVFPPNLS